jgi:hypothetical protein
VGRLRPRGSVVVRTAGLANALAGLGGPELLLPLLATAPARRSGEGGGGGGQLLAPRWQLGLVQVRDSLTTL